MRPAESLSEIVKREQTFHNEWAKSIRLEELLVREAFEAPTAVENQYALKALGDLRGKKLLDLGCGAGETSVYFALRGAEVYACDIAEEFLKVTKSLAEKFKVTVQTVPAEAGHLPFPAESFDLVFGNGVLHHVELLPATREISRVLKKGGKAVFIEPLPYNPFINIYRQIAKGVRTEDEKPLGFGQIRSMGPYFTSLEHREFWLFSLLIFFHFFLIRHWNPSKVRYWKKVIEEGESYRDMFATLQKVDHAALRYLPFLKPFCWNTVVVVTK